MPMVGNGIASLARLEPVLLVEDDEQLRATLKSLVAGLGCRRLTDVGTLEKSFEEIEFGAFALAIIDLHLGQMDGVSLIKAIRSDLRPATRAMPIIAASTRTSKDRIQAAIEAGADAFLGKPFSILNLHRQIQFACMKADQRRQGLQADPGSRRIEPRGDFFEID